MRESRMLPDYSSKRPGKLVHNLPGLFLFVSYIQIMIVMKKFFDFSKEFLLIYPEINFLEYTIFLEKTIQVVRIYIAGCQHIV